MKDIKGIIAAMFGVVERRRLVLLTIATAAGAMLEAVGIGLVVPFMSILSENDASQLPRLLKNTSEHFADYKSFVLFAALMLFASFLTKNLFLTWLTHAQLDFVAHNQVRISSQLYGAYLSKPIEFYSDKNSADLLRNVFEEVRLTFSHVVHPTMVVVSEVAVIGMLGVLILLTSPPTALIAIAVTILAGGLFYVAIRKHALEQGKIQQREAGQLIKWAQQGFGAIREILVNDRQDYFATRFRTHADAHANASKQGQFLRQLPRFAVETIGVAGLLLVLVALVGSERQKDMVPILSLFALAAVRVMPSVTRIIASLTSIRHHYPSLQVLLADLGELEPTLDSEDLVWSGNVDLAGVWFKYSTGEDWILSDISLTIAAGETTAIVGPSGSGKTTLASLILGLLQPDIGEVSSDGVGVNASPRSWRRRFGFIPQPVYLLDVSIRENVALGIEPDEIEDSRVWECLKTAQLDTHVAELADGLAAGVGELGGRMSGGQRQRLGIARALYEGPSFLVLDEATSALDPGTEAEITNALRALRGEKTMIVIAHRLQTIRDADQIIFLQDGIITGRGSFEELESTLPEFAEFVRLSTASMVAP